MRRRERKKLSDSFLGVKTVGAAHLSHKRAFHGSCDRALSQKGTLMGGKIFHSGDVEKTPFFHRARRRQGWDNIEVETIGNRREDKSKRRKRNTRGKKVIQSEGS